MLIEAALIGIVLGYIRGGRLYNLKDMPLKYFWIVVLAVVLQAGLGFLKEIPSYWGVVIHLLSYLLLFGFILLNFEHWGMKVIGFGVLLNFLVIAANQGTMPVSTTGMPEELIAVLRDGADGMHSMMTDSTRLPMLADIISIKYPFVNRGGWFSAGDIIMDFGLIGLISSYMRSRVSYYKVTTVKGQRS